MRGRLLYWWLAVMSKNCTHNCLVQIQSYVKALCHLNSMNPSFLFQNEPDSTKDGGSPGTDMNGSLSFQDLLNDLPQNVSTHMAKNLSVPIAFVCLLHLANEKVCFKVTGQWEGFFQSYTFVCTQVTIYMFLSDDYILHSSCQALVYYLTILPHLQGKKMMCTIVHLLQVTLITCYTSIIFDDFFCISGKFTTV